MPYQEKNTPKTRQSFTNSMEVRRIWISVYEAMGGDLILLLAPKPMPHTSGLAREWDQSPFSFSSMSLSCTQTLATAVCLTALPLAQSTGQHHEWDWFPALETEKSPWTEHFLLTSFLQFGWHSPQSKWDKWGVIQELTTTWLWGGPLWHCPIIVYQLYIVEAITNSAAGVPFSLLL